MAAKYATEQFHSLAVWLLSFSIPINDTYLDACERALSYASGYVLWLALLPARYTDCGRRRTVIAAYFYGYHALPPDRDRLLHALGWVCGMAKSILLHHEQGQRFSPEIYEMFGMSGAMKSLFWKINIVAKMAREKGYHRKGLTPYALRAMADPDWPGNVRELNNRVRRALIMCEGRYITPEDLGLERRKAKRFLKSLNKVREEAEKEAIAATLRYTQNNVTNAADILGVSRATLYRLMEKHEISPESS